MNKRHEIKIGTGASSILMIVITIVLTTFAVLSLATAQADMKLTEKTKKMTIEYYSAENKVQNIYSNIDTILASNLETDKQKSALKALNDTIIVGEDDLIDFIVPVNEIQQLAVRVQVLSENNTQKYRVIFQKLQNKSDWTPNTGINTWINK